MKEQELGKLVLHGWAVPVKSLTARRDLLGGFGRGLENAEGFLTLFPGKISLLGMLAVLYL